MKNAYPPPQKGLNINCRSTQTKVRSCTESGVQGEEKSGGEEKKHGNRRDKNTYSIAPREKRSLFGDQKKKN